MLICSIVVALLLAVIVRRLIGSSWVGFAFGLLLLTLPAFRFWLYLLRADLIGIAFSVIGITLYLLKQKGWIWSIPFFALAAFCKYSLLGAPLAVFVHLIVNRKKKQGIGFAMGLGSACLIAFFVLQSTTGGWFAFHMFSTHVDPYSLVQFLGLAALVAAKRSVGHGPCGVVCSTRSLRSQPSFSVYLLCIELPHCAHGWKARINDESLCRVDGGVLPVCGARLFVAMVEVPTAWDADNGAAKCLDPSCSHRGESLQRAAVRPIGGVWAGISTGSRFAVFSDSLPEPRTYTCCREAGRHFGSVCLR